jgi:hypothetical protein
MPVREKPDFGKPWYLLPMTPQPQLLDANELAQVLAIPKRQVGELYRRGIIPGVRLSHKFIRFDPSDVLRSLKEKNGKK